MRGADAVNLGPCPKCGSARKATSTGNEDELKQREKVGLKAKEAGATGKPALEMVSGDDLFRKTDSWRKLERVIDRKNDRYYEKITDPEAGEVIRHCEEPLSHHIGRGSAKFQDHGLTHDEIAYGTFCIYQEEQREGKCSGADANWYLAIERLKRIRQGVPNA